MNSTEATIVLVSINMANRICNHPTAIELPFGSESLHTPSISDIVRFWKVLLMECELDEDKKVLSVCFLILWEKLLQERVISSTSWKTLMVQLVHIVSKLNYDDHMSFIHFTGLSLDDYRINETYILSALNWETHSDPELFALLNQYINKVHFDAQEMSKHSFKFGAEMPIDLQKLESEEVAGFNALKEHHDVSNAVQLMFNYFYKMRILTSGEVFLFNQCLRNTGVIQP